MTTKTRITTDYDGKKNVTLYNTKTVDEVGHLALVLVERWGLITADADGEDSAGRAKVRPATPRETVVRAFDMAEAFWLEAAARSHVVDVPDLNELNADSDKRAELKAEARQS